MTAGKPSPAKKGQDKGQAGQGDDALVSTDVEEVKGDYAP